MKAPVAKSAAGAVGSVAATLAVIAEASGVRVSIVKWWRG
jgi:hypothetical protein